MLFKVFHDAAVPMKYVFKKCERVLSYLLIIIQRKNHF
ncbi:hypothetical protein NP493_122g06032 [Ridgeia piscesae]|uniref:Uncharacterized protein n=1 Tax=Ridgeia piscesae TaxID=27915 RepID=A0AAD9P643_RIDPI|nr:hypothetical protein NP493_122g06032 [Ridgeia piscesae]